MDRFVGVMEEDFGLFDWGDLASAHRSALAIPKHRIEYFKVDERVVWRKADRIDDVFGSTGSGRTIIDVLADLEQTTHYGTKLGHFETSNLALSHERGSKRSERASERVSAAEGASEVSSPEQANE